MTTSELVKSVSVDNILQQRAAYVDRITAAHRLLQEALEVEEAAFGDEVHARRSLSLECSYDRAHRFTCAEDLGHFVRKHDAAQWESLLAKSGLRTFMDTQARAKWDEMISKANVPELTRENIAATFEALYANRGEMFERGVVAVFKNLSWDYKTNNPVKLGRRIVHRGIVWTYGREIMGVESTGANRLDDLVRVMLILDGKPEPDHREASYRALTRAGWPKACQVAELSGVVSVRGFMNGNAHITFLRPDLVDKMNAIIAKHHPNALPPAREAR